MFLIFFSSFCSFSPLAYPQRTWNPFVGKTKTWQNILKKSKSRVKCQQKFWEVEWSKCGNSCIGLSGGKGGDSKLISACHTIGTGKTPEHDQFVPYYIIILLLGNDLMALFSHHTPFSFAETMIVSDIVFFFHRWIKVLVWRNQTSAFIEKKNQL